MSEKSLSDHIAAAVTKAVADELAKWDLSQVKPKEEFAGNAPENTDETMFAPAVVRQVGAITETVADDASNVASDPTQKPETGSKPKPEPGSIDEMLAGMI